MKIKALSAFHNLQKNELFTFNDVQQWLLDFESEFKDIKYNWSCPNSECRYKFTGSCSCTTKEDALLFLTLYERLLEFSFYHKNEAYARNELLVYEQVKNDIFECKQWVVRNEKIAGHDCFEFLMSYFSYSNDPKHLLVVDERLLGYNIFVDTKDFKHLISFLHIFDELFWIQKIYPESEMLCAFE
ncbi:hypothetical protein JJL45_02495 [Tamlana sp. s12]|uniref:hypothetical protein n=1 Tax=Tamlana sp. s12 TaxID=1630406 RepID=UPI00080149B4|nr:hypothetical protein [Tamlana sp. s12]OBQ56946.1 hypothetical protein VQ01_00175 [Tamlana sp. s12]QQY82880.1 hypothetical protein JJL45_02495 [Tamlana sp. s12]